MPRSLSRSNPELTARYASLEKPPSPQPSPPAKPGEREQVAQARNTEINSVNPLSPGFAGKREQVAQARNTEINSVNPLSPGFAGGEGAGCASTKHRDQLSQSPLPWLCQGRGDRLRKHETLRSTQSIPSPLALPGEREQVAQARSTEINSVNPLSPGFAGGEGWGEGAFSPQRHDASCRNSVYLRSARNVP